MKENMMTELLMYNQQNGKKKSNKIPYLAPNGLISHGKTRLCVWFPQLATVSRTHRSPRLTCHILYFLGLFTPYTTLIFNCVPVKQLPERNTLPRLETHNFKHMHIFANWKNYPEFCWLWFLLILSHTKYPRSHGWAQFKLTAPMALVIFSYFQMPKKTQGLSHQLAAFKPSPPKLQLVGLREDLMRISTISHRPI